MKTVNPKHPVIDKLSFTHTISCNQLSAIFFTTKSFIYHLLPIRGTHYSTCGTHWLNLAKHCTTCGTDSLILAKHCSTCGTDRLIPATNTLMFGTDRLTIATNCSTIYPNTPFFAKNTPVFAKNTPVFGSYLHLICSFSIHFLNRLHPNINVNFGLRHKTQFYGKAKLCNSHH